MSEPRREASEHDRELARWLERVREGYAPPDPTPAQRAAFDVRLRERLERPPRVARWLPVSMDAVLLDDGSAYGEGDDAEDALPPAYAAIASAWLE
jgi:hypothetical protein